MPAATLAPTHYRITFSKGTSRHDETRRVTTVPADKLAARITGLQARPNTWIHAVDIDHTTAR